MQQSDPGAPLTSAQAAAAGAGHKALMPIGADGCPFLDYVIAELAEAGAREVCLVVGPDPDPVRTHYLGHPPSRARLEFAVQPVADGTARALLAAERFVGGEPFLVLNADNLYQASTLGQLIALAGPGLPAYERDALARASGFPSERIAAFALIEVDPHGILQGIVEKPAPDRVAAAGPNVLVSMNVWRFDARIFDACRAVSISRRGEYELPEAVALSVARGVVYTVIRAAGPVIDLSRRSDVAAVAERLGAQGGSW